MNYIDLSHTFENNMPGFRMKSKTGSIINYSAKIYPFLTHDETRPNFENGVSFEITQVEFQSSVGTYLDSPYHRFPEMSDISELSIDDLIVDGVCINARDVRSQQALILDKRITGIDITSKAVLFNFGWDQYWGEEQYHKQPYISEEVIDYLITQNVKLVGVDTINIDDSRNLQRPAHTKFLRNSIPIVENLTNLDQLFDTNFRFFAVPIKAKQVAAMPIRAFAELTEK